MGTELVTLTPAAYPALDPKNERVQLLMQNLGGESLSVMDFGRIKTPLQGGTKWTVETAAGGEMVDVLEGVILFTTRRRAYWADPDPSQTPPDCSSVDMIEGKGNPGGLCADCPLDQWESAPKGKGKACKETRVFFFLRPGQVLPDVISAAPTSLKPVRKYLIDLAQVGAPYYAVVTRFGLESARNEAGTAYTKITARMVGMLDDASRENILTTIKQYRGTFEKVASPDYGTEEETQEV